MISIFDLIMDVASLLINQITWINVSQKFIKLIPRQHLEIMENITRNDLQNVDMMISHEWTNTSCYINISLIVHYISMLLHIVRIVLSREFT